MSSGWSMDNSFGGNNRVLRVHNLLKIPSACSLIKTNNKASPNTPAIGKFRAAFVFYGRSALRTPARYRR